MLRDDEADESEDEAAPLMQDDAALLMEAGGLASSSASAPAARAPSPSPAPFAPADDEYDENDDEADGVLPRELVCPITQELMRDPVLAADGFSYERLAMQRWFGTGQRRRTPDQPLPRYDTLHLRRIQRLTRLSGRCGDLGHSGSI